MQALTKSETEVVRLQQDVERANDNVEYLKGRVAALEATERKLLADLRRTRGGVSWDVPLQGPAGAAAAADGAAEAEETADRPENLTSVESLQQALR